MGTEKEWGAGKDADWLTSADRARRAQFSAGFRAEVRVARGGGR